MAVTITLLTLIVALTIAQQTPTEYVSSVPQELSDIFVAAGSPCATDMDCIDLYEIPHNVTAFWTCVEDNINGTEISFCQMIGCEDNDDCEANEYCAHLNQCDDANNAFYDESFYLYSTLCLVNTFCDDIVTPSPWTDDTMCYIGEDGNTYYSEEEAVLCGNNEGKGTCVDMDASTTCKESTSDSSAECVSEKTCCSEDGWDEEGCLELLMTEYLVYTIAALGVLYICCTGCCFCCIRRSRKSAQTFENMENETNHYNVYI